MREKLLKIKGCINKIILFLAAYCSIQQTWYQIDDWHARIQEFSSGGGGGGGPGQSHTKKL